MIMRFLVAAASVSFLPLSLSAAPPAPAAPRDDPAVLPAPMPNHFGTPAGCESIPQQVTGEDKEYRGTRLDRLPPGKLLHAVERKVDGCPVVTFVAEERQRQLRTGR
jgi:hypothetical protein